MITVHDIRSTIRKLELCNHVLCVHSSLRSFGWVEGGAKTIIDGLLAEGCTVMVPTFSWKYAIDPPVGMKPQRNGWDYNSPPDVPRQGANLVYTPDCNDIDQKFMGAIPTALLNMPGRIRGGHPLGSFSAVGPLADKLITKHDPADFFAPLDALMAHNGWIVLMGVDLTSMTILHLAEKDAGRVPFRRWANGPNGHPMEVEAGGCSGGFNSFMSALHPLSRTQNVGASVWQAFPASLTVASAIEAIHRNPHITHCGDIGCSRCNDGIAGGPISP